MKTFSIAAAVIVTMLPAVAPAQSGLLGRVLKAMTVPAAQGASAPTPVRPIAVVEPSAEQARAIHEAVAARQTNPDIAKDMAAAAPLIERLIRTSACGVNDTAWRVLNRDAVTPSNYGPSQGYVARGEDQYHDPRYCQDVLRLSDVRKPAANALAFTVYYISPQSQAAHHQTFELLRTPEGAWMVKTIGMVWG
ncbi:MULTISPECIES: hypothetical protein [unclassified Sphingomonas]|uniref:hypothetical protein n=1 Tax=unclassified Sphingomonas TaxID=196159 RepID=UPI00285EC853|nr:MULTISPECIES: hypothetical protein [unclassified Sphingomonas]MDR6115801.1 hypothetical protein [Sphingomonas sp. SORGH_AS_0789]MDR6150528.1 hypothetical protein [Sphingomonas sp. SORGH_AS_0742]